MLHCPDFAFSPVASAPGAGMVGLANPCMGSFVGRDATTTHTEKCGRVSTNRRATGTRMTDFGGQQ